MKTKIRNSRAIPVTKVLFVSLIGMCILSFIYNSYDTDDNVIEESSSLTTEKWIYIDENVYIYSAYWDSRIKPFFVRIVGIGLNEDNRNVSHITCALKYSQRNIVTTAIAYNRIAEDHGNDHTAVFYFCPTHQAPLEVALFAKSRENLTWLRVNKIKPNGMGHKKLAICVQPLYNDFADNNLHVAEFISHYQLLNATRFTFYDYKASASLRSILVELSKNGVSIETLKWDLPDAVRDAWSFAQLAAIADCVYRQSRSHDYVFIVDFDEFLVPRSTDTLQNLIESVDKKRKWCSYVFRQSFFCLQQSDDNSVRTDVNLYTLNKVLREKRIWSSYSRSKSIVRPASVIMPGIHYVWSVVPSWYPMMEIEPDVALLHHYRGGISDKECNDNMVDKSAVKYGLLIINSMPIQVWKRWNKYRNYNARIS